MQPFDLGLARAVVNGTLLMETALINAHSEGDLREYMKVAQRDLGTY